MSWITIKKIFADPSPLLKTDLEVRGWIRTQRTSKNLAFIELNDGSCFKNLQIVYGDDLANFSEINKFPLGSALKITGKLLPSPAAGQPFELKADAIAVIGLSSLEYPLQKKRHSFEYLRTIAHLRPRTNTFGAVFRVRSLLAHAIHRFFHERGFRLRAHAHHHRQRLRRAPGRCSASPPWTWQNPPLNERQDRFQPGFLRPGNRPDRQRPARRRAVCLAFNRYLYFRPDLPRRKFQHRPPRLRVLDDRAGNGLCRPGRRYASWRKTC